MRFSRIHLGVFFGFFPALLLVTSVLGAEAKKTTKVEAAKKIELGADVQAAKILLETIISSRYQRELGTFLSEENFKLSTEIALKEIEKASENEEPTTEGDFIPADLMLGRFTPEELVSKLERDETGSQIEKAKNLLSAYSITQARIAIGLSPETPAETKTKIEGWIKDRLTKEFGASGTSVVQNLAVLPKLVSPEKPKTSLEQIRDFQPLIGQLLIALALILGVLLWQGLGYRLKSSNELKSDGANQSKENESTTKGAATATATASAEPSPDTLALERAASDERKITELKEKILDCLPQFEGISEPMIKYWCNQGTEGFKKLALLAESAGSRLGRLPIPADLKREIGKTFETSFELPVSERLSALTKIYSDIVTGIKIGVESFDRPFSSVATVRSEFIRDAMLSNSPRFQTLVSLFMPTATQSDLIKGLPFAAKESVLLQALELSEVEESELQKTEVELRQKLISSKPIGRVKMDSPFSNILRHFSPLEEIRALKSVKSPAFEELKRKEFTLSGIAEWMDAPLATLLGRAMPDEVAAYASEFSDQSERLLSLCPPMTSELARDEMSRIDQMATERKNEILQSLKDRVTGMLESGELIIGNVFKELASDTEQTGNDENTNVGMQKAA
jgi:flagellar motor switch protein FliG